MPSSAPRRFAITALLSSPRPVYQDFQTPTADISTWIVRQTYFDVKWENARTRGGRNARTPHPSPPLAPRKAD